MCPRDVTHMAVVGRELERERTPRLARDELVDERVGAKSGEPAWGLAGDRRTVDEWGIDCEGRMLGERHGGKKLGER